MPSNNSTAPTSKKKRGGSSKKVKCSSDGTAKEKRRGNHKDATSVTKKILYLVLVCWLIFGAAGLILYLNRGPSPALLKAREKRIKEQQQKQAFVADVASGSKGNRNRLTKLNDVTINEEQLWDPPDPRIAALVLQACQEIYCHGSLKVVGRTLRATAPIEVGVKLYEIPRSMQIWDLDAYRDPFVRKHLFKASHMISGNQMGTEAFLSAYLALEINKAEHNPSNFDPLRLTYFESLPTLEEFQEYHPILADKDLMSEILGVKSMAHSVLQAYRNMVISEYDGFTAVSPEFASRISRDEYMRARLAVLTRALSVGPPGPEEVMTASFIGDEFRDEDLFLDELYSYYDLINVNLTEAGGRGCIAMIPIADMFNHHPNNNIDLQYKRMETHPQTKEKSGRSFIVTSSSRGIEVFSEPMVSRVIPPEIEDNELRILQNFDTFERITHNQFSSHDVLLRAPY